MRTVSPNNKIDIEVITVGFQSPQFIGLLSLADPELQKRGN